MCKFQGTNAVTRLFIRVPSNYTKALIKTNLKCLKDISCFCLSSVVFLFEFSIFWLKNAALHTLLFAFIYTLFKIIFIFILIILITFFIIVAFRHFPYLSLIGMEHLLQFFLSILSNVFIQKKIIVIFFRERLF